MKTFIGHFRLRKTKKWFQNRRKRRQVNGKTSDRAKSDLKFWGKII